MRGVGTLVAVVLASGCIRSELVECDDGRACRVGTVCATLTENAAPLCLEPAQLAPCEGAQLLDACEVGACYASSVGLVCLASGCGNGLHDQGEVCDDGNAETGDGCSASCLSNETCGNGIVDSLPASGVAEECDDGNYVGRDGCASDCQSESPGWSQIVPKAPDATFGAGIAYDSARDRVVMFGGGFQATPIPVPRGATYEWDGKGWIRIPTFVSPSSRTYPFMAYDAERRRTVVFGGAANSSSIFGDTWEWDGVSWTLRNPTVRPSPRVNGGMVYDAARKRIVLFGGSAGTAVLDDTWEWDGTEWREVAVNVKPPARRAPAMTYDPVRGVVVMAGGASSTSLTDTWELEGTTWRNVATAVTPSDMVTTPIAFDGQHVVGFGGFNGTRMTGTTYRYDGQVWSVALAESSAPSSRGYAMLVFDPLRSRTLLFGGVFASTSPTIWATRSDTFEWNGSAWTELLTPEPASRTLHAAAFDTLRGRVIIHGGADGLFSATDHADSWAFVGAHWEPLIPAPTARHSAAMAYDAKRRQVVMFGGSNNNITRSDTWILDGNAWSEVTPATVPPARGGHAMAYDPVREVVVMFGGADNNVGKNDTWEWNGTNWTLRMMVSPPAARAGAALSWDPVRQRVVLFGGEGVNRTFNDTWEWDGTTWTDVTGPQAPAPRGFTDLVWNGPRRSHTVYAGSSGLFAVLDDTWERRASEWAQQPVPAPPVARQGATSAPLADGSGIVVFGGGVANAVVNDLWQLRWRNTGRYELCTVDVDEDRDGLAGCADPDCWATCTPECPPGAACNMAWPRCGNGVCEPRETCRICPGDCTCTPVCGDNVCDPGETSCAGDC